MDFTTLGLVGGLATGPMALWLRLRCGCGKSRRAYLVGIAQPSPGEGGSTDKCGDGTRLRLVVNGSSEHE